MVLKFTTYPPLLKCSEARSGAAPPSATHAVRGLHRHVARAAMSGDRWAAWPHLFWVGGSQSLGRQGPPCLCSASISLSIILASTEALAPSSACVILVAPNGCRTSTSRLAG